MMTKTKKRKPDATAVDTWHWLTSDGRLAYPPRDLVVAGGIYTNPRDAGGHTGPLVMCIRGYHGSVRALDALKYAPGPICCRVRLSGEILADTDKLCASRREVIWLADATTVLHLFACDVAEEALQRERSYDREPDARSWQAIRVKRAWVTGEATDQDLAAARDAARDAAWDAARDAAWDAARAAQNATLEARLFALGATTTSGASP